QAMIELAQAKNVILQVGHIERFNPVLRQLEERMDQPRFIEVHRLSPFPNRSMDIGVVLDVMIHDIEIVLHLVKSPLIQIDAVGIPVLTKREDIANARLKFANGCIANITASRISPEKMRKIRVFQQDSYLSLDYQEQSGWIYRKDGMQIVREAVEVEKDEPLKLEIAAFVECSRHGKRPVVTGQEGAEAVRIALEITDQIEKNAALAG
ncbi:MAG TPA: oxidoreductase, partial [Verrucomicrobiales bacterium]|nr:oxidoreductase [Verrucomicrobiales bacterium]